MKAVAFIFFLALATMVSAQHLLDAPTNKSKTFVILLDSVGVDAGYQMAAQVLMDAGYQLAQSDAALHTFTTDWMRGSGFFVHDLSLSVNVRPNGSGCQVQLSGKVRTKNSTADMKAMFGGDYLIDDVEKRSNAGKYWKELEAVAVQLGGQVRYM